MITRISWRSLSAVAAYVALGLLATSAAQAGEVTFVGWGGSSSDAYRSAFLTPFAKRTGAKIIEDKYNGEIALIKAQVESGNITWDVVAAGSDATVALCEEGLLERVDYNAIGGKDHFLGGGAKECGIGVLVWSTIFGFDSERITNGPSNWGEFWDVKKFPGARALRKSPQGNLEFALVADGVPFEQVYDILGTDEGIDRAFAKLDELKPYVKVWWTSGAQPAQLLSDGEVAYSTAYSNRLLHANRNLGQDLTIRWNGQLYDVEYLVVVKGTPNKETAMQLLAFASTPEAQADLANTMGVGPAVKGASEMLIPEVRPNIPSTHLDEGFSYDINFWAENGEVLNERFNAWLGQ